MTPKVDELLRGMIVQSGNDASVVLAEAVGGTVEEFVAMMNRQAQAMGLKNTAFKNVTGLTEPGHKSTARDLATTAARIIRDFPEYFPYYSIKEYKYNNIAQPNRNLLLLDPLCLLLVGGAIAQLRGRQPGRWFGIVLWTVVALAGAALLIHWLSMLQPQFNLQWIALLLPVHAALAWAFTRRRLQR
jgi:hypothetical protein